MMAKSSYEFPRRPRNALDYPAMLEMHEAVMALLQMELATGNDESGSVLYSKNNVVLNLPKNGTGGAYIAGEWDPSASYPDLTKGTQVIVIFTPDGGAAGTYFSLPGVTGIPAGTSPDTGSPFWGKLPNASPGMWM